MRIPLEQDRRMFVPVPRGTDAWKRAYARRTAVERVNSPGNSRQRLGRTGAVDSVPSTPSTTPDASDVPASPSTASAALADVLIAIVPQLSRTAADRIGPELETAMASAAINTPLRKAAFLAQIAHESAHFRTTVESEGDLLVNTRDLAVVELVVGRGRIVSRKGTIRVKDGDGAKVLAVSSGDVD